MINKKLTVCPFKFVDIKGISWNLSNQIKWFSIIEIWLTEAENNFQ